MSANSGRAPHRATRPSGALRGRTTATPRPKRSTPTRHKTRTARSTGVSAPRKRRIPDPFVPGPSHRGRRLAPSYDLEGPRVRLGVLWCAAVFGALGLGRLVLDLPLVGLVYAAVAAVAALQIVDAWVNKPRSAVLRTTAAGCAAVVGVSSSFGARALGGAILLVVAVAIVIGVVQMTRRRNLFATVALELQASLPVGMVAASVILTTRYEIGAAVVLIAMAMAYDLGDFIIGSGAGSLIEGPIAGGVMVLLVGAATAILGAPPFDGGFAWAFAAGAVLMCPMGQVAASWLLPDSRTRAGALRRLDSMLILAPLWAWMSGIVAAHG